MMSIQALRSNIPDTAKDIRLNLAAVLSEDGTPELSTTQRYGIALASAYASKQAEVINSVKQSAEEFLSSDELTAAKAAASIMAMNNIYYRFVHLVKDKEFSSMPARLRMNVIGNPGIAKIDFELYSLAVSAINSCGMCIEAHTHALIKEGVSKLAIQAAVRIAAVINATAQAIETR